MGYDGFRSFSNNLQKINKNVPLFSGKLPINLNQVLLLLGELKSREGREPHKIIHGNIEKPGKGFQHGQIRLMLALLIVADTRFAQTDQVAELLLRHMPGITKLF